MDGYISSEIGGAGHFTAVVYTCGRRARPAERSEIDHIAMSPEERVSC